MGDPTDRPKTLRRSLSHVGGTSRFTGDETLRATLERAALAPSGTEPRDDGSEDDGEDSSASVTPPTDIARALTHGFHAWPGRLHPHTARELIRVAPPGVIADPFMGAGTVPLEAMLQGRASFGNDLNPIGAEVAWVRTRRFSKGAIQALVGRAKAVVKKADGLKGPMEPEFRLALDKWFDNEALWDVWAIAKCLREGDSAWQGSPEDPLTRVLKMALSSVLVKASRQVSDSVAKLDKNATGPTPPGRVGHWFKKRTTELAGQLEAFAAAVPRDVPEPTLTLGDARTPPDRPPLAAIISSPPYPGVYDYLAHHALRCTVLGLPLGAATQHEIGSRRASERLGKTAAHLRYVDDLSRVLRAWSATLIPGGFIVLVIGDGQVGNEVVRVVPLLAKAAAAANLQVRATLSQRRPTFGPPTENAQAPRKDEHLIWLEPLSQAAATDNP